jgi:hypothetical protein
MFGFSVCAQAQSPTGAHSVRLDLDGGGAILVKSSTGTADGMISQLLHEKPGGAKILLAETGNFDFTALHLGDLDGDQIPEIIAIAKNRGTDDFLPFIFQGQTDFRLIFPPREEDNPLIGKEISIIPGQPSAGLCLKVLVPYHDFGPPEMYVNHLYRLRNGKLVKTHEQPHKVTHFNQQLNLAAHFFHKGEFLKALREFQGVLASSSAQMPPDAQAEAHFGLGETYKFLKDYTKAMACFDLVCQTYPESEAAERAQEEQDFLATYQSHGQALSLLIDVSRQERAGKLNDALNLLDAGMKTVPATGIEDVLLLRKGELLMALGRSDEALKTLKTIQTRFPNSPKAGDVESLIQELEIPPDETD